MWTAKLEGERESFQRAARTGAGARSPSSSTGPQDGGRAGERAIQRTTFARATGWIGRREEEQGKTSAAAAILSAHSPLIRPSAINLRVHGYKSLQHCQFWVN